MDRCLELFQTGGVSFALFILIIGLCIVALIAADKVGETAGLLAGAAVVYYLLPLYGPLPPDLMPFGRALAPGGDTILSLLGSDLGGFAEELLGVFVLVVLVKLFFLIAKPISAWVKDISRFWGAIAQFFLYYAACVAGMWSYGFLKLYLNSALPRAWAAGLAGLVFLFTVLVLLSPVADYVAAAAGLIPNPVLNKLSSFIKEHTLGGALQAIFYATFFSAALLVILQEAGVVF